MPRKDLVEYAIRKAMELESIQRQIHGVKSERVISEEILEQLKLDLGEIGQAGAPPETEQISYERKKARKKPDHPGRHPLPSDLPRKEIIIEPEEDTTGMNKIGEEITETLGYTPPKFYVNRYIRPKYARPDGSGVITAPMPSRPIEKGIAEASLLGQILNDKYLDHIPLYRQIQRFKRIGVRISDSTIDGWITQVCRLLDPLFQAHRRIVLTQSYLMVDETTIKVMDGRKKGKTHLGYYWVYYSPLEKLVLFDYQPSRGSPEPLKCLKNYQGYLQTDGYAAYNQFADKEGVVMLGCMAHARRKFFEAGPKLPDAKYAIEVFRKLYAIERKAKDYQLTPEQRRKIRDEEAKPIWEDFKNWLIIHLPSHTPKSKLRQAIEYTLKRWVELGRYILKGELEIDNEKPCRSRFSMDRESDQTRCRGTKELSLCRKPRWCQKRRNDLLPLVNMQNARNRSLPMVDRCAPKNPYPYSQSY